jgi:hypothetical protein
MVVFKTIKAGVQDVKMLAVREFGNGEKIKFWRLYNDVGKCKCGAPAKEVTISAYSDSKLKIIHYHFLVCRVCGEDSSAFRFA